MRTDIPDFGTIPASDAAEAADRRRSIRAYDTRQIPEAAVRELLRLTGRAPSAYNAQPSRFVVVKDPGLKADLSAAAYGQQQILRAPVTIVMYNDMADALERMPESMHPDLPREKRESGVESFLATFNRKSVEEREAWGTHSPTSRSAISCYSPRPRDMAPSPCSGLIRTE